MLMYTSGQGNWHIGINFKDGRYWTYSQQSPYLINMKSKDVTWSWNNGGLNGRGQSLLKTYFASGGRCGFVLKNAKRINSTLEIDTISVFPKHFKFSFEFKLDEFEIGTPGSSKLTRTLLTLSNFDNDAEAESNGCQQHGKGYKMPKVMIESKHSPLSGTDMNHMILFNFLFPDNLIP